MSVMIAIAVAALLTALSLLVSGLARPQRATWVCAAGCVGLVGVMVGIFTDALPGVVAPLCAAVFAAVAAAPVAIQRRELAGPALSLSGAFASALGVGALVLASVPQGAPPAQAYDSLIPIAGQWCAWSAALSCLASGCGAALWRDGAAGTRAAPYGAALLVLGALGALAALGALRAPIESLHYMIPLSDGQGPLWWTLPDRAGSALALRAALPVPALFGCIGLSALLVLGALVAARLKRTRQAALLWAGAGVGALAGLGALIMTGLSATLPDAAPYLAHAREVGAQLQIPDRIIAQGGFASTTTVAVLWADVLVELALLSLIASWSGLCAWWSFKGSQAQPQRDVDDEAHAGRLGWDVVGALHARDLIMRAVALVWTGWLLGMFATWRLHAVQGFGSPQEWSALGVALCVAGLAMMAHAPSPVWRRVAPGLMGALLMLLIVASLAMGTPPQVAMRF